MSSGAVLKVFTTTSFRRIQRRVLFIPSPFGLLRLCIYCYL